MDDRFIMVYRNWASENVMKLLITKCLPYIKWIKIWMPYSNQSMFGILAFGILLIPIIFGTQDVEIKNNFGVYCFFQADSNAFTHTY